jgi:hypothetical protein
LSNNALGINRVVEALKTALGDADFAEFRLRRCRVVG